MPSRPWSVQAQLFHDLRDRIIRGHLSPGARLRPEELAREYGVSKMPVREALRDLAMEGLVTLVPYREARVAELSLAELEEVFFLRVLLEGEATRLGTQRLETDELRSLASLVQAMYAAVTDHDQWLHLDKEFHMTIYRASGNRRLAHFIHLLRNDIERYVRRYIGTEDNIGRSMRSHEAILHACQRHDPEGAAQATRSHLQEVRELFVRSTVGDSRE